MPREGAGDARELGSHFADHVWHRVQWAGCWPAARGLPPGGHVALRNEYMRVDELDVPATEKTRAMVSWLSERIDPDVVEREMAAIEAVVRRFDDCDQPHGLVKRLRVAAPEHEQPPPAPN
jgi:hypothetical protein